ncbi:MAG: hypothetical protein LBM69_08510, partial [Lachnospiraceae bacterium]|nr:hypothetical protein [Lachnospiraceae bacterium]
ELFAWQKENLQYRMNQASATMTAGYFKLLGIKRAHRKAAQTSILVQVQKDRMIPRKTRFYAKEMCFETVERRKLIACPIEACVFSTKEADRLIRVEAKQEGKPLREPLFGSNPTVGNSFTIVFASAIWVEDVVRIGIRLREAPEYRRSYPHDPAFIPLGAYQVEYLIRRGDDKNPEEDDKEWKELTVWRDDTLGFLYDGEMVLVPVEKGTWMREIRFTLTRDGYEVPPMLIGLHPNTLSLRQQLTRIECHDFGNKADQGWKESDTAYLVTCDTWLSLYGNAMVFLGKEGRFQKATYTKTTDYNSMTCTYQIPKLQRMGETEDPINAIKVVSFEPIPVFYTDKAQQGIEQSSGICAAMADGLPAQGYRMEEEGVVTEDFAIMVLEEDGFYYVWERKEDFFASTAQDRHFILEETEIGKEGFPVLHFGDGIRGKIPKGPILVTSYVCSYGALGNVKANTINKWSVWDAEESFEPSDGIPMEDKHILIQHDVAGTGGRGEEKVDACIARFVREMQENHTLVTAQDYENAVIKTPGLLIDSCRVIDWQDGILRMVVRPGSECESIRFHDVFAQNIIRFLEQRRMLGVMVVLEPPVYVELDIICRIVLCAGATAKTQGMEDAIRTFFWERRKELGKPLFHREITALLERNPMVEQVKSMELDTKEERVLRNATGDLLFSPGQIAKVNHIKITTSY